MTTPTKPPISTRHDLGKHPRLVRATILPHHLSSTYPSSETSHLDRRRRVLASADAGQYRAVEAPVWRLRWKGCGRTCSGPGIDTAPLPRSSCCTTTPEQLSLQADVCALHICHGLWRFLGYLINSLWGSPIARFCRCKTHHPHNLRSQPASASHVYSWGSARKLVWPLQR